MIIASLTTFKLDPLKRDWGAFRQMRDLADVVIVCCDSCHVFDWTPIAGKDMRIDEVLEIHNHDPAWQDYTNRLTLLARAAAHKADWVLWLDDDEVLLNTSRDILRAQIAEATTRGWVGFSYEKREMWSETHYRSDGLWGRKYKPVAQRNPLLQEAVHWRGTHLQRLHALPYQIGDIGHFPESMLVHYGMSSAALRADRHRRHQRADPGNRLQPEGYDYFLDQSGLQLTPIPSPKADRESQPNERKND